MSGQYPRRLGSLDRSPVRLLAPKIASLIKTYRTATLAVTVDPRLAVWLELPGQEIPDDLCGYYDTARHWLDLATQIEADLLARKCELLPDRTAD